HFFYEYYYDPLGTEANKEFSFTLNSLYPIDDLLLEVQEPARASNFQLEPQPATNRVDSSLALTYHQLQVGQVAAGEDVSVAVRYVKTDPAPSLSWQQVMALEDAQAPVMPVMAAPPAGAAHEPDSGSLLALLAGAGLALLVLGIGYVAWRAPQPSPAAGRSSSQFCPGCGTALRAGALFCHSCGTPGPTLRHPAADLPQRDGAAGCSPLEVRL
ncbi:MAG TPA: zinc ribbon domain-containing protein, partial [Anaerolineae bacterium]|nr:zinc ribbon domain-containing protein [Anaerolineae bacterium]